MTQEQRSCASVGEAVKKGWEPNELLLVKEGVPNSEPKWCSFNAQHTAQHFPQVPIKELARTFQVETLAQQPPPPPKKKKTHTHPPPFLPNSELPYSQFA